MSARSLIVAFVGVACVLVLAMWRYGEPRPRPLDAPEDVFSGERAHAALSHLLAEGVPHPVGSLENRRVRDRILSAMEGQGYRVEVQVRFVCGIYGSCATVENVLAWRPEAPPVPVEDAPGAGGPSSVALVAHYDSVPAAPGGGDDGSGVATLLEIARLHAAAPLTRHPILFLFTDGEEVGLLGAQAFLDDHPLASSVAAVINVEASGTAGPAAMFQTGADNAGWVRAFARVPRPVGSSLAYEVYRRLPADTDFTHFVQRDVGGLNFALIGRRIHYHTPLDHPENVSAGALQHQGDSVVAVLRALDRHDDPALPATGDAVFTDVVGLFVLWWPEGATLAVAGVPLVGLLAALVLGWRRRRAPFGRGIRSAGRLAAGALAVGLAVGGAYVVGVTVKVLLEHFGAAPTPFVAHPLPAYVAAAASGAAVALLLCGLAARLVGTEAVFIGGAIGICGVAPVAAALLPASAPLVALPAWAAATATLAWAAFGWRAKPAWPLAAALALPTVAAALFWIPLAWLVPMALGLDALPVQATAFGVVAALTGGVRTPDRIVAPVAGIAVAGLVFAVALPAHTPDRPAPLVIERLHLLDSADSRWLVYGAVDAIPSALARVLDLDPTEPPYPWSPVDDRLPVAPAPFTSIEGADAEVSRGPGGAPSRTVHVSVRPRRAVRFIALAVPTGARVVSARLHGERADMPAQFPYAGWTFHAIHAPSPDGTTFEVVVEGDDPVEAWLIDWSMGLPPDGAPLDTARGDAAVPIHYGDGVRTARRLSL